MWDPAQIRAHINSPTWPADYLRVVRFAVNKVRLMKIAMAGGTTGPLVVDFLSLVNDCIEDLLSGTRTLPRSVSIRLGLQFIVKSKISHLFNSAGTKKRVAISHDERGDDDDGFDEQLLSLEDFQRTLWDIDDPADPAEILEAKEAMDRFCHFCAYDPLVAGVIQLVRDENLYHPAAVVAKRLNVSVDEIYNAHRRLEDRLDAFRKLPE